MTPRESLRAQLQSELPSRNMYKSLQYTHTAMHVNGKAKQADDGINAPGISQAVRGHSDLPARALGAASTLPPAPHSPRHGRLSAVTTRPDHCGISRHHPQSRKCPSRFPCLRCYTCKINLRQNHQNHDRCEADVEVSATHQGASRTETIRRIGGPSKRGVNAAHPLRAENRLHPREQ